MRGLPHSLYFFFQYRDHILKIVHDAVVGHGEDGGAGVFVDGDDRIGVLHGGHMLKGSADADGKIDLGFHCFAGDPNLTLFGEPVPVHHGSGAGDHSS